MKQKALPTEPGYYWMRGTGLDWTVVLAEKDRHGAMDIKTMITNRFRPISTYRDCEFAGPLPEPVDHIVDVNETMEGEAGS